MSDDDESARAEAILAAEAEEEAQLELAMQLLRTQSSDDTPSLRFKSSAAPTTTTAAKANTPQPTAASSNDAAAASVDANGASASAAAATGDSSAPSTAAAATPADPAPSASPTASSKPKGLIDKKKKSFSTGAMDIDALMGLSSSSDEEEKEKKAAAAAARKAKLAAANASKKAATTAAAAAAQPQKQLSQTSTPQQRRTPSQSPVRGPSPARSLRSSIVVQKKGSNSRPVSGVSPAMLPPPSSSPSSHTSSHSLHPPQQHQSSQRERDREREHEQSQQRSPRRSHSHHSSSAANAALESRIRELEQHYHDQSYSRPHTSPAPAQPSPSHHHHQHQALRSSMDSSQLSPNGADSRGGLNQLKLRILELEKDAMGSAHRIEELERKIQQQAEALAKQQREALEQEAASRDRENKSRVDLSAQISELEQRNFQLDSDLKSLRALGVAQESSYRELLAAGGPATQLPQAALQDPKEVAKIHAELRAADLLINEMNRDNQKLHGELKIAEAKHRNQIAQALQDQKNLRFELANKSSEVARLQSAQNSILDPAARERIIELTNAAALAKETHHQEVSGLRYELDKLRSVKVELSMRKEDATSMGRDSLRLTLESLQEKYNNLKQSKEVEVRELHAKLVWYIENQPLITTLQEQLAAAQKSCRDLQDENLVMNHLLPAGSRAEATGREIKLKPRPQDSKRIKELETKVAELTDMIKRKSAATNASSTAAAAAAAAAGGTAGAPLVGLIAAIKPSMEEHDLIVSLRSQIATLEAESLRRDEDSVSSLRSLRQENDQVKLLYEKRLAKLNKELEDARKRIPLAGRKKIDRISELERTVEETRRTYADKIKSLQNIVRKLRRGERLEEAEVQEATTGEEEAVAGQQQPQKEEESKEAPPNAHDSLRVPGAGGTSAHNLSTDADFPRSPLRAHAQPHPSPSSAGASMGPSSLPLPLSQPNNSNSSRDFLLFKQSLSESHDRELHLLSSKYESQVEALKLQWESQVHLLRATHEADAKLLHSLLGQARDEVVHVRTTLTQEMSQRSILQDRCLKLESELQHAKNQGGYVDYHHMQHQLELINVKFEQKIREYENAAAVTREDIRVERSGWEEQVRQKNDQLAHAKQRFQQLTMALKNMQEHMQRLQQQQQQQQQGYGGMHADHQPGSAAALGSGGGGVEGVPHVEYAGSAAIPPPTAAFPPDLTDEDDDIAHLTSPRRGLVPLSSSSASAVASYMQPPMSQPQPPINEQTMQLQWSYLIGTVPTPHGQPQAQQPQSVPQHQPQQTTQLQSPPPATTRPSPSPRVRQPARVAFAPVRG